MAEKMMVTLAESGHTVFRATSPLSRGELKSEGGGKLSIHHCADQQTIKIVFEHLFLKISSIFSGQSQKCVKNMNLVPIKRKDPLWEDNRVLRSRQVWSRQTCLWLVMITFPKIFFCQDTENELKSYHNKTDWANFVRMQDSCPQLKSDSISWRKTLKNSHNLQMHWPVVSTFCQEMKTFLNQKIGSKGTPRLGPFWKLQVVAYKVNRGWKSESSPSTRYILTRGSDFLMTWINWTQTWTRTKTTTSRKLQKCSSKNLRLNWMQVILQAEHRPKQNHNDATLPVHPQERYLLCREYISNYREWLRKFVRIQHEYQHERWGTTNMTQTTSTSTSTRTTTRASCTCEHGT